MAQREFRVASANVVDWRDRSRSFALLGLFSASTLALTGTGDARELRGVPPKRPSQSAWLSTTTRGESSRSSLASMRRRAAGRTPNAAK
jgi:hypothetical protein